MRKRSRSRRSGSLRPLVLAVQAPRYALSGHGKELDPVAVRVSDLDADKPVIVLPFGLHRAGVTQPLARASNLFGVLKLETEVVGAGQPVRHRALAQRDERTVRRSKDQKVLVLVHPFGQPEVLAVEGFRSVPIVNSQRDMVQWHPSIISGRAVEKVG
jgi:hypothetical protein